MPSTSAGWIAPTKICAVLMLAFAFPACSSGRDAHVFLAPPPPAFTAPADDGKGSSERITLNTRSTLMIPGDGQVLGLQSDEPAVPAGCKLKDRFDRSSALSFSSADGTEKLALNVRGDMASVEKVMLKYTHKFQPGKNKKERCLYPSRVQGLTASLYHEFVVRENNTVWQHIRALKNDLVD